MIERATFRIDEADVPALRAVLSNIARAGYSETSERERLALPDIADLQWRALPIYRDERLSTHDPLALTIELFLLQGSLSPDELCGLLAAEDRDVLTKVGLLTRDNEGAARASASLFPVGENLIFSDHAWPELPHPGYSAFPYDQVMFVGIDSRFLARSTSRRPVRAALDLCTGSGIHALLAATHSERAVAVDINPRAVHCARNARASGIDNLEAMEGDLFEPVRGERFDLITANPPFVPSPVNAIRFRDGGHSGEEIQRRIVAGLPDHLAPGGMAQIVTELGEHDGEPIVNRLREWLDGAPMDIHVLRLNEYTATKYAIGHAKGDEYPEFLDSVQAWAGNLRAQGYARVVSVIVSFQWSDPACGAPWERVEASQPPRRAAGSEIEATFTAERFARRSDLCQVLARSCVRRAGPVALFDAQVLGGKIPANAKAILLGQTLPIERLLDRIEREVLYRMEGCTTVSELLSISGDLGISESRVLAAIASLVRQRLACIDPPTATSKFPTQ